MADKDKKLTADQLKRPIRNAINDDRRGSNQPLALALYRPADGKALPGYIKEAEDKLMMQVAKAAIRAYRKGWVDENSHVVPLEEEGNILAAKTALAEAYKKAGVEEEAASAHAGALEELSSAYAIPERIEQLTAVMNGKSVGSIDAIATRRLIDNTVEAIYKTMDDTRANHRDLFLPVDRRQAVPDAIIIAEKALIRPMVAFILEAEERRGASVVDPDSAKSIKDAVNSASTALQCAYRNYHEQNPPAHAAQSRWSAGSRASTERDAFYTAARRKVAETLGVGPGSLALEVLPAKLRGRDGPSR